MVTTLCFPACVGILVVRPFVSRVLAVRVSVRRACAKLDIFLVKSSVADPSFTLSFDRQSESHST